MKKSFRCLLSSRLLNLQASHLFYWHLHRTNQGPISLKAFHSKFKIDRNLSLNWFSAWGHNKILQISQKNSCNHISKSCSNRFIRILIRIITSTKFELWWKNLKLNGSEAITNWDMSPRRDCNSKKSTNPIKFIPPQTLSIYTSEDPWLS